MASTLGLLGGGCLAGAASGLAFARLFWQRGDAVKRCVELEKSKSKSNQDLPPRSKSEGDSKGRRQMSLLGFRAAQLQQVRSGKPNAACPPSPENPHRKPQRRKSCMFAVNEHKVIEQKLVIAMVGLPARGKSYISKAIVRYLNFMGCHTRLFNAGNLRRDAGKAGIGANFFDSSNEDAKKLREQLAMECLEELLDFLQEESVHSAVGILDATNTTLERRRKVKERCLREPGVRLIWLESICDDQEVLKNNYQLKCGNEDYEGMSAASALMDFNDRVKKYEAVYEPVVDEECDERCGYIKLVNAGRSMICHRCRSKEDEYGVMRHIIGLMHSIDLSKRCIMLALVGETENDRSRLLGGDSSLTPEGFRHAEAIASIVSDRENVDGKPMMVMCGTLLRHLQTAEELQVTSKLVRSRTVLKLQRLNEICSGTLDSLSRKDIQEQYPDEHEARKRDKLNYRFPGPGGESYEDLVQRMIELICRLEQFRGNVVVLCDKAVCRVLLAYFRGVPLEKMPMLEVPSGVTLFERSHVGFAEKHIQTEGMHPTLGSELKLSSLAGEEVTSPQQSQGS